MSAQFHRGVVREAKASLRLNSVPVLLKIEGWNIGVDRVSLGTLVLQRPTGIQTHNPKLSSSKPDAA